MAADTPYDAPVVVLSIVITPPTGRRFTRMSGEWKKKSRITRLAEKSLRSLVWLSSPPVLAH
ncbi:hypothetical protein LEX56_003354 [Salmonella enterica]|nr:hypothetical protein [Salmonella enterica]EKO1087264.1 hypothetical protein [Salmonella enterica subsp. enterica]ELJ2719901.1 hypothetical protein [Salmonella enterica subsp. diarizonae]EIF0100964.1 hypothetical protein [Salmonella enterica]EJM3787840.1 hypothetical protein [Salmonella enterica]